MQEGDWIFILHWAPSLGVAFLLGIAALILQAQERRSTAGSGGRAMHKQ